MFYVYIDLNIVLLMTKMNLIYHIVNDIFRVTCPINWSRIGRVGRHCLAHVAKPVESRSGANFEGHD